jgi:hypothetical protein
MGIPVPVLVIRIEIRRIVIKGAHILRPVFRSRQASVWLLIDIRSSDPGQPLWFKGDCPTVLLFKWDDCFRSFSRNDIVQQPLCGLLSIAKAMKGYLGTIEA